MTDLAALRADYPAWRFTSTWATAGSGPDRRTLLAVRRSDGLLVGGRTEAAIREQIAREEKGLACQG